MAEKIESSSENNGEFDSDEIMSCKNCTNNGLDIESGGFCIDCRIFLCKQCITCHRQRERQSHIVIDVESGCAYLGDNCSRRLGGIWVPNDSEANTFPPEDAYNLGKLENTDDDRDSRDSNYKDSDDCSSTDEWISPEQEECCPQDFLVEPGEKRRVRPSMMRFFSKLDRESKKPNEKATSSAKEVLHKYEDDSQLDTKQRDGIRSFGFITSTNIPVKGNGNVSSVAMLTEDKLVIVDNGNNCVIVIKVFQHKVKLKGTIEFSDTPFCVARMCNNKFVVTFPDEHAVRFVDIKGKHFHVGRAREVYGACFGIAMLDNNMVIAYPASELVRILTQNGHVLKTMKTESVHLSFEYGHITVYEKSIYIIDRLQKCVCKCNLLQEEFQASLTPGIVHFPDDIPTDLTISPSGDLYVAFPKSKKIARISGSTMKIDCMYDSSNGVHMVECLSCYQGILAALEYKPSRAEIEIRMFEI